MNFYLNKKIESYLQAEIKSVSGGEYALLLGDISTNFFDMSVSIKTIKLMPAELFKNNKKTRYSITANEVKLKALDLIEYYKNKALFANKLQFGNLAISVFKSADDASKTEVVFNRDLPMIYSVIADKFSSVKINLVQVSNTKVRIYNTPVYSGEVFTSEKRDIRINNFNINNNLQQINKLSFSDILHSELGKFSYTTEHGNTGKLYTTDKNSQVLHSDLLLKVDSVRVVPNYKKSTF